MTYIKGNTYSTNDSNFIIEFYDIGEYSMAKYCSPVRIKRSIDQTYIFDNNQIFFYLNMWSPTDSFTEIGTYPYLLLSQITQPNPNEWKFPTIIFDLKNNCFSCIDKDLDEIGLKLNDPIYTQANILNSFADLSFLEWKKLSELK